MYQPTENIFFTKGIDSIPKIKRPSFDKKIQKALNVTTNASVSRRANGIFGTSVKQQVRLERLFLQYGVENWRGKARKRKTVKTV